MKDFEICRNQDGSYALFDLHTEHIIDGVFVKDTGQDPVKVAATAYTDGGQKFYVALPVRRAMIEQASNVIDEQLRLSAEYWERGH